jgi:predicted ABC-type ATPase
VPIEQAQLARARRFATEMIFVATDSIDENVARIRQRAQGGGHGASEREVRAIHEASLANLSAAIKAFERVDVYDSTALWSTPRLVATSHDGRLNRLGIGPTWLKDALSISES